jgi:hypothetical protein
MTYQNHCSLSIRECCVLVNLNILDPYFPNANGTSKIHAEKWCLMNYMVIFVLHLAGKVLKISL